MIETPAPASASHPTAWQDPRTLAAQPLRLLFLLFAVYAVWTIPSLLPRWGASPLGGLLFMAWLALAALAIPLARGRLTGPLIGALIGVALAVRLAAVIALAGHAAAADPLIYTQMARDLIAGGPMAYQDRLTGIRFAALYPPLYPLFLASIGSLFGLGPAVIALTNVVLDLAAAALLVRIGDRLDSRRGGLTAAWLYLVWPTFILATPFAQKEPLVAVLVLAIVPQMLQLRRDPTAVPRATSLRAGAIIGVLGGLLALTQPGLVTVPLVFGLALLPLTGLRPMVMLGLRSLPFFLLVMLPWWIRNLLVLGHFVPLTTTGGIGLWIGNNPAATGNWMPLPPEIARLPELDQSAAASAAARAWIVAHPVDMLRLNVTKLLRAYGIEQFTLVRFGLVTPALAPGYAPLLFPLLQGALLAILAAATVATGIVRRTATGHWPLLLTLAIVAQLILFDLWFEFAERHRYVAMPFLFLLIGLALASTRKPGAKA